MKKYTSYQNLDYYICTPDNEEFNNVCKECEENIVEPNLIDNDGTLLFHNLTYGSDFLIVCKDKDRVVGYNSVVVNNNSLYI